jgi:hypothetical protein
MSTFKTRDLTPEEARRYNDAQMAIAEAQLQQREHECALRAKYVLPQEVALDTSGTFLFQGKPLRDKAKPGAPDRLKHKADPEEMKHSNDLRRAVEDAQNAQRRMLHELRKACDAPHYAQLNSQWQWIASDDPRQPPRLLATPQVEEEDDGDA